MNDLLERGLFTGSNEAGFKLTLFGEEVAAECCLRWDEEIEVCLGVVCV